MEKVYTKSEIVQMLEDLKSEERADCAAWCEHFIGVERVKLQHDSTVIIATLNTVLLALDEINPD